jgi:predicted nucleotidyltransferase
MTKEQIIDQLRILKPVLKEKYGVTEIALFGSYSRNEATSDSDIDLLVNFDVPSARSLFSSYDLLQESFHNIPVQLVSKGAIKQQYFKAIEKDLIYA